MAGTFSESWYRVARQRLCLRPGVIARRQNFRGERWIVLENPFNNQFFRLRPEAYEFVARLRRDTTVEDVWQECLARFPDGAPGQEAAIQLLSQLYFANLLQYDDATDAAQLFERFKKRQQREVGSRFLNIMFMRFPLWDPDRFLVRTLPVVGPFISLWGVLLWITMVGFGVHAVLGKGGALWDHTQSVLSPGNLPLLYVTLAVVKTIHEFGHAYFCRKWGGEVHVMGVMLMIFTPVPYMDATSSWSFRNKWRRVLVGAAGMIVEIFVAAIAAVVWANTGPGAMHNIAYDVMFVASVSTLIFNLNPLLRFDGYYILSDLVEVPNLSQRANAQIRHVCEHRLFGVKKSESPARTTGGAWGYGIFGVTSGIYRVFVFTGVLLAVADRFLILGLLMAAVCLIAWVSVPLIKLVKYLASDPKLDRVRGRAIAVTLVLILGVLSVFQFAPFPSHFRAPGIVRARERTELVSRTAGEVAQIVAKPGSQVKAGQPLIKLRNRELELELEQNAARAEEIEARLLKATKEDTADIGALRQTQAAIGERLAKLQEDVANLTVVAGHDGTWIAPGIQDYMGRWLTRGSNLGLVVNPAAFEFQATVLQEDADALFAKLPPGAEVRLLDSVGSVLDVGSWKVLPGEQRILPSAALGWRGGGEVPVDLNDERGNKAAEPYFKVIAALPPGVTVFDGSSGKIRFRLDSEPLLPRGLRRLWQLLQKRYQM